MIGAASLLLAVLFYGWFFWVCLEGVRDSSSPRVKKGSPRRCAGAAETVPEA